MFVFIFFSLLFSFSINAQGVRNVTTKIVRLKTLSGPNEKAPCNRLMDYYAEIVQGTGLEHASLGLVQQDATSKTYAEWEGNDIRPAWSLKTVFPMDEDNAMIVIKVYDKDDALCGGKDDIVDVSFASKQSFLRLWVDLKAQRVYKVNLEDTGNPLIPKYKKGNYIGRTGTEFSLKGNTSNDHAAEITVKVSVTTETVPEGYYPNKSASLTIALFDDSPFFNLIQNAQLAYGNCFEGYDKSVLLKRTYSGSRKPDRHLKNPSKATFFSELKALAEDGYYIDIFIFSHGFDNKISLLENQEEITGEDIIEELYDNAGQFSRGKFPIRLVYGVHCFGATLRDEFVQVGAKAVVGARRVNFYPNQANKFISEWNKGNVSVSSAYRNSNTTSSRTVMQALIKLDANFESPCFRPKCKFGKTVLSTDSNDCAYNYFDCKWGLDYNKYKGDDGMDIMNHSSDMLFSGDMTMIKYNRFTW